MATRLEIQKRAYFKKQTVIRKREKEGFLKLSEEEIDLQISKTENEIAASPVSIATAHQTVDRLRDEYRRKISTAQSELDALSAKAAPARDAWHVAHENRGFVARNFTGDSDESARLWKALKDIEEQIRKKKDEVHEKPAPRPKEIQEILLLENTLNSLKRLKSRKLATREKDDRRQKELVDLKATAAAAIGKTRKFADAIRSQIEKSDICPYCGCSLNAADCHLDHIYPVSKGGQSRPANVVFVCSTCNIRKKDMTLNLFIDTFNLDRHIITTRLRLLGNDY